MSEWRQMAFQDVLVDGAISYGIVQPGSHTEMDSVPIIRVNNIKNGCIETRDVLKVAADIERKFLRTRLLGGELLITVVGSIGECAIVPERLKGWNVARAVSVARINENADARFVKYAFKSEDLIFQMYGGTNDTVQPTLNLSVLKSLQLKLPSLPEQQAIAGVLSSLDDKIDLLHRQNKTLEDMAETLFRQWFVEAASDDWLELPLSSIVAHLKVGVNPSNDPEKVFQHFSLPAFDNGRSSTTETGSQILSNKYAIEAGTILVSKLNPRFPRIWALRKPPENAVCSTEFQVLKPNSEQLFAYVYFLLCSAQARDQLSMAASGTSGSHQRVRPQDILNIQCVFPSEEYARRFSQIADHFIRKIDSNTLQLRTLERLRDTLLPKLMSGDVRVQYE